MSLINEELRNALVEQWGHEIYNSHLYLSIMAYLKNKGFDNISKIFFHQFKEEQEHAQIILNLLTDLNADFKSPLINECELEFSGLSNIAKVYLEREISTTESLNALKILAMDVENPVVEEKMREMISLQQAEYEEATTFMDKAKILNDDWTAILLYDSSLGE